MKHRHIGTALAVSALFMGLTPSPTEALTLTYSDKTGRLTQLWQFRGGYDLPFGLRLMGGLAFAPDLTSLVPPPGTVPTTTATNPLALSYDTLIDLDANLGYNFQVFAADAPGFGAVTGTLTPYIGYRQMWTNTGSAGVTGLNNMSTSLSGLNYGANFHLGLPLGFSGNAYLGASSMFGGSSSLSGTSTPIDTKGVFLPQFGLNAAWQLPFWNIASAYIGYSGTLYPEDLRLATTFSGKTTLVNGFTIGLRVLWLSL